MEKIIFIAGPVRGDGTLDSQKKNIEEARKYIRILIENNIPYYSPHLNIDQEVISMDKGLSQFSWDMNAEFLRRSQALAALPGWESSSGTKQEIENARKINLPVFYLDQEGTIEKIKNWLNE